MQRLDDDEKALDRKALDQEEKKTEKRGLKLVELNKWEVKRMLKHAQRDGIEFLEGNVKEKERVEKIKSMDGVKGGKGVPYVAKSSSMLSSENCKFTRIQHSI